MRLPLADLRGFGGLGRSKWLIVHEARPMGLQYTALAVGPLFAAPLSARHLTWGIEDRRGRHPGKPNE
jgi:hypothetical protein